MTGSGIRIKKGKRGKGWKNGCKISVERVAYRKNQKLKSKKQNDKLKFKKKARGNFAFYNVILIFNLWYLILLCGLYLLTRSFRWKAAR
jgi:hypothetical protein